MLNVEGFEKEQGWTATGWMNMTDYLDPYLYESKMGPPGVPTQSQPTCKSSLFTKNPQSRVPSLVHLSDEIKWVRG